MSPLLLLLAATTESFAIVVANTDSTDGTLPKLSYADDDGARWYELLSLTSRVRLLSVLDADTQRQFPRVAEVARVPSRKELDLALDETFEEISKARDRGARTALFFVFAGHGSIGEDGQGYVHLVGGRFTRSDLFRRVATESPATVNHIVIDACNSYFMVASRGSKEDESAIAVFLGQEDTASFPSTGFLVSTSKAAEVHEWSRFASGVFSHEVRSALAGAADANGDGRVGYDEVRAFVAAANSAVKDPRARLSIHATPPAVNLEEALFDRAQSRGPELVVPRELAGRLWLEDERGVRYLDLNMAKGSEVTLSLVPSSVYFLKSETTEIRIPIAPTQKAVASRFPATKPRLVPRGSEELTFQNELFQVPFGADFVEGWKASGELDPTRRLVSAGDGVSARSVATGGAAVAAALALTGSVIFGLSANADAAKYRSAVGDSDVVDGYRTEAESSARTANVLLAIGGGLVVTSLALWLWP